MERWALSLFAAATLAAQVTPAEYAERRARLRAALGESALVLYGATDRDGDTRDGFFQEPNFLYLTGWSEPGAVLLLGPGNYEWLLVPPRAPEMDKWHGRRSGPEDKGLAARTGFAKIAPTTQLESLLTGLLDRSGKLYALAAHPKTAALQALTPLREWQDAALPIARLRMKKSPAELALLEKSIAATIAAHRRSWDVAAPGRHEYEVAAAMGKTYFDHGCERHAYPPIVGAGASSVILHYSANRRRMDAGDVLLMDVGAECSAYAADLTRTIPVNGKFTPRQREIYDLVLEAQRAAIAASKPGAMIAQVKQAAIDVFKKKNLERHFTHGIGHHIGLDVHDAWDKEMALAPGMVITIEPGLYIPEENLGVRIEDMILITESEAKVLSAALPREAAAIESAMRKR
ncbi:MAG: Xaa-Pro peptidase family protein [Bryobacter sp.]|nr:Xaa-Pro peptidase family protein [Bryobacter sp.]